MGIELDREVSDTRGMVYGRTTVGLVPVPLTGRRTLDNTNKLFRGVDIVANPNNTTNVYVGLSTVSISDGMPLRPGFSISLPIDDPSFVWVAAEDDGQQVAWIGV